MKSVGQFAIEVLKWLPAIQSSIEGALEAAAWGRARVEAMVAEDRDPNEAEWDELNSRTEALRAALHMD